MEKIALLIFCLLQLCVTHVAAGDSIPSPGRPEPILEYATAISFHKSSYVVGKNSPPEPIKLVLNNSFPLNFTVQIVDREGTATRGKDYRPGPYGITFTAGRRSVTLDTPVIDDLLVEQVEVFSLFINASSLPVGVVVGNISYARITIYNDDSSVVFFANTTYCINESKGLVGSTLKLSNPVSTDVNIIVRDQSGSATGNEDYSIATHNVTLTAGKTIMPFYIQIVNDGALEEPEDFILTVEQTSELYDNEVTVRVGTLNQSRVIIMDDNVATTTTVYFSQSTYRVNESSGTIQLALALTNPLPTDVTIQVVDDAAIISEPPFATNIKEDQEEKDYFIETLSITFAAGTTSAILNVAINNDDIDESDETFTFTIDPFSLLMDGITVGYPYQTAVTIVDDDIGAVTPVVFFDQSTYSVDEKTGLVQLVLYLSQPWPVDFTVQVIDHNITATGGGVDYSIDSSVVKFTAGQTNVPLSVTINYDDVCELVDEMFTLEIDQYSILIEDINVAHPYHATVIIVDECVTISFSEFYYSVGEDDGLVKLAVKLSKTLSNDVTVQVLSNDGTAVAGDGKDYATGPYNVSIPAGQLEVFFSIAIHDDNIKENHERFTVNIDQSSLPSYIIVDNPSEAVVDIKNDDDYITVSFSEFYYSVGEDDDLVELAVKLSKTLPNDVTVQVLNNDGTAVAGDGKDYTSGPYDVNIPAGQLEVFFSIAIHDDNIKENYENFTVNIDQSSLPSYIIVDNSSEAVVDIADDDSLPFDMEISFIDEEGNATRGKDYKFVSNSVTITAGSTRVRIPNAIRDDGLVEGDEYFTVTIDSSSLPNGVLIGHTGQATVIIEDDDVAVVYFKDSVRSFTESSGLVNLILTLSGPVSNDVIVEVVDEPGNATGEDYTTGPYYVTFTAGRTNVSLNISITQDTMLENPEYFTLTIQPTALLHSRGVQVGHGSYRQAIVFIIDDSEVVVNTVSFEKEAYSVNEATGQVEVALVLNEASPTDIAVTVSSTNALATDTDYNTGPYSVTFPAGRTNASLTLTIIDDNVVEVNENFTLSIDQSSLPNNVAIGNHSQTTVTILDDDYGIVQFENSTYYVDESAGSVQLVLLISDSSSFPYMVSVTASDGSATGRSNDYNPEPHDVEIPAGETRVTFTVSVNNDDIFEGNENFTLTINVSLPTGIMVGEPGQATVIIVDDDPIIVFFNESTYSVDEGSEHLKLALALTKPSSIDITLQVTVTAGGTATAGDDYTGSGPFYITFPAGDDHVMFIISITNDDVVEDTESFTLSINPSSLPSGVTVDDPSQATVTIIDDDIQVNSNLTLTLMPLAGTQLILITNVTFSQSSYNVNEDDGLIQLMLTLSNPTSFDVTISVTVVEGNATEGVDYDVTLHNVSFTAGVTNSHLSISIIDDSVLEGDEYLMVFINSEPLPLNVHRNHPYSALLTIKDDESIMDDKITIVSFEELTYSVDENDGTVELVLLLSDSLSTNVTIQVVATDGSATGGVVDDGSGSGSAMSLPQPDTDYYTGPYSVTFPAGRTRASLTVTISDDDVVEVNENFILSIDQSSLPDNVTIDNRNHTTVTILDDDVAVIAFEQLLYNAIESEGVVQCALTLSQSLPTDTVINVVDTENTAIGGGEDYISGPYAVTIAAGDQRVEFNVSLNDDNVIEQSESFHLTIDNSTLPSKVTIDQPDPATVYIIDDGDAAVSFNRSTYIINEGSGQVELTLVLSAQTAFDVTVNVSVTQGNATGRLDYDFEQTSVTFLPGETTVRFNVTIINDDVSDGNEYLMLEITDATGAFLGFPRFSSITILDDDTITGVNDIVVNFEELTYSVDEDDGTVELVLLLSDSLSTDVTIQVVTTDGSATGGDVDDGSGSVVPLSYPSDIDYNTGPYSVTFHSGATRALCVVAINDDNEVEGTEDFTLSIDPSSLPSNLTIGDPGQATVTIRDNDDYTVKFEQSTYDVNEDAGLVQLVLLFSNLIPFSFSIQVNATGGSATGGDKDYGFSEVFTVEANMSNFSFDVRINDDNIFEGNENFILTIETLSSNIMVGDPGQTTVTIIDNDPIEVFFNESTYSVNENEGSVHPILVLSNPSSSDITVQVTSTAVTATEDDDFASGPYTVVFRAGVTFALLNIVISNDDVVEDNESFILSINAFSLPISVTANQTIVIIVDDDDKDDSVVVFFNESLYNVTEDTGSLKIVLVLSSPLSFNVTVQVEVTAAGKGDELSSGPFSATFSPGDTLASFTVTIIDDDVVEEAENFILSIDPSSLPGAVSAGNPAQITVTVFDDDVATVSFEQSEYSIDEGSPIVLPMLLLSSPLSYRLDVRVLASDITANGKEDLETSGFSMIGIDGEVEDYDATPFYIRILPNKTLIPFTVSIYDDDVYEGNETFTLTIQESFLPPNVIVGEHGHATVTIVDNEFEFITLSFDQSTYTVNENGGPLKPLLILSNPSSFDITVHIMSNDNTAMKEDDYNNSGPYMATFSAGMTFASFDVTIINDNMPEDNENFGLEIINSSLPTGVILGAVSQTTVTIVDDDVVNLVVGQDVKLGTGKRVIIDCGPLIDATEVAEPNVNWYHNENELSSGSVLNVVISQDNRLCTITETALDFGGQLGNGGNYACEVCHNMSTCRSNSTIIDVCGEPHLLPPSSPPMVSSSFTSLTCGQNVTLPPSGVDVLTITCDIFNGSDVVAMEVFKNGVSIGSISRALTISNFADKDFGNYTFVVATRRCGSTSTVSWILPDCTIKGQVNKECASHPNCTKTCNNRNNPVACIQACIPYGCECPNGMVVDEERNECVATSECPDVLLVVCPQLTDPNNGMINCSLRDDGVPSYEDTCSYTCNTGYELTGNDTRTCQSDGSWSGNDVMCSRATTISFDQPTYSVNEADGKVEPVLVLSNPSSSVITIQVFDINETALGGGVDYNSGPYTVQFNVGVTNVTFNVTLKDDSSKEDNETFTLSINSSSLPNSINIGDHAETTVTILNDDDQPCGSDRIDGKFHENSTHFNLQFSGGHPDLVYTCRTNNQQKFGECSGLQQLNDMYLLPLDRDITFVIVAAFCNVDGKLERERRRKFTR